MNGTTKWWVMRVARGTRVVGPVGHTEEVRRNRRRKASRPAWTPASLVWCRIEGAVRLARKIMEGERRVEMKKLACTESQRDKAHGFADLWTSRHRFVIEVEGVEKSQVEVEVTMRTWAGDTVEEKHISSEALMTVSDELTSWLEGL
jgi:hypothetical protein